MELWSEIRSRIKSGELSMRQACSQYQLNFRTVQKIVNHAEPRPYQTARPRGKPKLGSFLGVIEEILQADLHAPPKQRHTARRIYERLRDEHNYQGCASIVRDAVREYKHRQAEAFVPLLHPPGEAQCDFGRARVIVAGQEWQAALFVLTLPYSNARFGYLFPRECAEAFHAGHAHAFAFFGGVPRLVTYDNTRIAVARLIGRHERGLTREFLRLQSHFGFAHHFCAAYEPQEKGNVENGVGYVRRNFLVPVPRADSWEGLNAPLAEACRRDQGRTCAGRDRPTAELLAADRAAFLPLPDEPFEARRVELATINSLLLGRFDGNDYSVPTALAYQVLSVSGSVDRVRFSHRGQVVAEHPRCWGKGQVIFEPLHYLALLERKPGALDHARPLAGWSLPEAFGTLRRRLEEADPQGGTRQYIRVLRLLESHDLPRVTAAVERALSLHLADADAIRLLLQAAAEVPAAGFDLAERPGLQAIRLPAPDLAVYGSLTSAKGVKP